MHATEDAAVTVTLTDEMRAALEDGPVEFVDEQTGRRFVLTPQEEEVPGDLSPEDIEVLSQALQPAIDEADAGLARPWNPGDMQRIGRQMRDAHLQEDAEK